MTQRITLLREQGFTGNLLGLIGQQTSIPNAPHVISMRIICLLESHQREAAREAFDQAAIDGFRNQIIASRSLSWFAEACVALGDTERARLLYDRLVDRADQNIVTGSTDLTGGSVSYYLGLLATLMGDWEDAERRFAAALAMNERWGIRPYVAHTQFAWAEMLVQRNDPGDQERALELASRALALAVEIGMTSLADRARTMTARLAASPAPPARSHRNQHGLTARELDVLQLVASGQPAREIAAALYISPHTVERHLANIYNKLGVNSRAAAAAYAVREGLA
jgi:DNA-binding CsgD family transcriptional regulator